MGLPPSLEEQEQLTTLDSPEAYAQLVDRLLANRGYGERWARHWLDLVRYADSNGYERDGSKPSVWRYRDYVIDSLNADKPYDRFVVEQLAGDELPDRSLETVIATGFHALGAWQDEVDPLEAAQYRADELDDMLRTTAQTFLGVTIGCARCHNHKFDPISMVDYYSLSAILAPLRRPNGGREDHDMPAGSLAQLQAIEVRDKKIAELNRADRRTAIARRKRNGWNRERASCPRKLIAAFRDPTQSRCQQVAAGSETCGRMASGNHRRDVGRSSSADCRIRAGDSEAATRDARSAASVFPVRRHNGTAAIVSASFGPSIESGTADAASRAGGIDAVATDVRARQKSQPAAADSPLPNGLSIPQIH